MLSAKEKLTLQREALGIKKQLADVKDIRQRLALQKRWSELLKQLKGDDAGAAQPDIEGRLSFLTSPKGGQIRAVFKVVEAKRLIVSNFADGRVNPDYPEELQPRDRTRQASVLQIAKISNDLQPARLTDSGLTSHGAPIIGRDFVVESGNGRTISIIKAYTDGKGENYRNFLIEHAEQYGLKPDYVAKFKRPVLVRMRLTEVDRAQFARDSNASDLQSMSAAETAWVDAEQISGQMMAMFRPADSGTLTGPDNKAFVDAFIKQIGDAGAAGLYTGDGRPTRQLVDRLQNAIFAKAYRSERLVALVAEETDPEIRNILSAMNYAAADFVEMQALSAEVHHGVVDGLSDGAERYKSAPDGDRPNIAQEALQALVSATELIRQAKANNQSVKDLLSQSSLFGDNDPAAEALAAFVAANNRSSKRMSFAFKRLAENINAELARKGSAVDDLFGGGDLTLVDILARVNEDLIAEFGADVSTFDTNALDIKTQDEPARQEESAPAPVTAEQAAIDEAANNAATSGQNELPEPTQAQKEAGNYKKGHLVFAGIDIAIENPAGSTRSGTDENGNTWSNTMQHHYGDIKSTTGADGDPVDVFLGDVLEPEQVFIIDQINPTTRTFDEHKVMLGFASTAQAKAAYLANYDKGWKGLGAITAMPLDQFKSWAFAGAKTSAVAYQAGGLPEVEAPPAETIPTLKPADYVNYAPAELKQRMMAAHERGFTEENIIEVFAYWLDKNVSNGAFTRPDFSA